MRGSERTGPEMNGALWFLLTRSLWNGVVFRLKRLRQPKYAIGALLGGAYFYFYFYRFLFRGDFDAPRAPLRDVDLGITPELVVNLGALALFAFTIVFSWVTPASRAALTFSEAEIAYLLPAPISRAGLIRFKLLKSQLGLLLLALLMTLLTGRFARDGHAWLHAGGWWVVFATLQLHRLGASFVLTRLMDRGLSNMWRRLLVLSAIAALAGVLLAWRQSAPAHPDLASLFTGGNLGTYLGELVVTGPAPWLLAPFRLVVSPWFATDAASFVRALWPALAIMALHYVWVMRSEVSFEEASIALSEKRSAFLAARRAGDTRMTLAPRRRKTAVFMLRPTGWVPVAFIWKSWIQAGGQSMFRYGAAIAALLFTVALALHRMENAFVFLPGFVGFSACIAVLFIGPQATAQMMRRELSAGDWLKAAPVRGRQIVLGQLCGPACSGTAVQLAGLGIIWASGFAVDELPPVVFQFTPLIFLTAVIVLPAFNLVTSLVPTAVMLLFPGWFKPGEQRGIEAAGLGIVMMFGQLVFLMLALIPPGLAFFAVGFCVQLIGPTWLAAFCAGLVAAATLAIEGWLGVLILGGVWDRFDPSRE